MRSTIMTTRRYSTASQWLSSSEKEKSIINYSFLNIESGIVNRLHKDLILSVIAAARFQIQTEKLKQ